MSDTLPSVIDNPTATLTQSIGTAGVSVATADPSADISTAQAVSGLTTITGPQTLVQSGTTFTTEITRTITDSAEYASLTSAAALGEFSSESVPLPSSTASPTSIASPTPNPAPKPGLSTGAKAGIAIGVIGLTILLATLLFCSKRSRHRGRRRDITPLGETPHIYAKAELEGSPGMMRFKNTSKPELSATTSEILCAELNSSNEANASINSVKPPMRLSSRFDSGGRNESEKEVAPSEHHDRPLPQPIRTPTSNGIDYSTPPWRFNTSPEKEEDTPKYLVHDDDRPSRTIHGGLSQLSMPIIPPRNNDADGNGEVTINRLKAEHAALAERIRLVEMKELERERQKLRGTGTI